MSKRRRDKMSGKNKIAKLPRALLVAVIIIAACSSAVFAGEGSPSVNVDLNLGSKYVWRGLLLTDDPVLQPSLTIGYKKLSLNFWANNDLTDRGTSGESEITEFDYTLDYSSSVDQFSYSLGVIQYTFPDVGEGTTELYGSIGYDFVVSPTLTVYYDTDEAGGIYANLGLGYSLSLPEVAELSPSLDLSGSIAYASSGWNKLYYGVDDSAFVDLLLTATLSVPIDDHISVGPFVSYSFLVDSKLENAVEAAGSDEDPVSSPTF
jgi:uncharacterized protein (TIGR02001 family)